jgi:hypothetical protein
MKRWCLVITLIIGLVADCAASSAPRPGAAAGSSPSGAKIHWYSLAEGMKAAAAEKKPMVVDFYVPAGCSRCRKMAMNVYAKPEIISKLNESFIPIHIDLSGKLSKEEKALGEKFAYKEDCLLLFLKHNGDIIQEPSGKQICTADAVDSGWYMERLERTLQENAQP